MKKLFVLFAAVALVVAFTAPAFAAEWSFYGSSRITTFWTDVSDEVGPNGDDDLDLNHSLQGNSRIGANVKVSDNLVGKFEYGASGGNANIRVLWGEYDFGGFKLGVGQNYTPLNWFPSNQVYDGDADLLGTGGVYQGRRAMVQARFGGFKIALVQPNTPEVVSAADADDILGVPAGTIGTDIDVVIPQIQAGYRFKMGGLDLEFAAGYQTYDQEWFVVATGDDLDDSFDSYAVAFNAMYNAGPFYFAADGWMGKNVGNLGFATFGNPPNNFASYDPVDEDVLDNDGWGFLLVAAFTLSDMLKFEAGYGYAEADLDDADSEDDSSSYYVNCTINLAKGVFIVPEIGHYDLGDDQNGDDEGDITYYGLKWQINF